MEKETVDSQTGRVAVAVVQSGNGGRTDPGVKRWSHAKAVMDEWVQQLEQRLSQWGCE